MVAFEARFKIWWSDFCSQGDEFYRGLLTRLSRLIFWYDPVSQNAPLRGQRRVPRGAGSGHDEAATNHMLAERRRRIKQKENFTSLRKLVPIISKVYCNLSPFTLLDVIWWNLKFLKDNQRWCCICLLFSHDMQADKASILGDAVLYIKSLQGRVSELELRRAETESRYENLKKAHQELEQRNKELEAIIAARHGGEASSSQLQKPEDNPDREGGPFTLSSRDNSLWRKWKLHYTRDILTLPENASKAPCDRGNTSSRQSFSRHHVTYTAMAMCVWINYGMPPNHQQLSYRIERRYDGSRLGDDPLFNQFTVDQRLRQRGCPAKGRFTLHQFCTKFSSAPLLVKLEKFETSILHWKTSAALQLL